MKKLLVIFLTCASLFSSAQQIKFVQDKEGLFTYDEVYSIDSLLQEYYQRTSNVIIIATDSSNVEDTSYKNEFYLQHFTGNNINVVGMMFLMSRKNQRIFLTAPKPLVTYVSQPLLMELIKPGLPAIKEQRREEGVMLICNEIMKFLYDLKVEKK